MPSAVNADANARLAATLPKARMIDPRGHRFGAGVSAILLIVAFVTGTPWLVAVVLLSIGVSAAFGLRYSIYGAIWRRIVKVAGLGPTEPEHEYPPRFAQVLGSVALDHVAGRLRRGRDPARLAVRPRRRRPAVAPRGHRVLPRLPAVLPAMVGAGPRDAHLDARRVVAGRLAVEPISYK